MKKNAIDLILDDIKKDIAKETKKITKKSTQYATEQSTNLLKKTYDSIIEQYYLYKTTFYYRHDTGVGTRNGINLYRSNDISMNADYEINIIIDSKDMDGYSNISKKSVLEMIFNYGIRGVPYDNWDLFRARISGENVNGLHSIYEGTPRNVLDNIIYDTKNKYFYDYFYNSFKNEIKSDKYAYFKEYKKKWR